MSTIRIPVRACKLSLFPGSAATPSRRIRSDAQRLRAIELGLAVPSFWTDSEITEAFRLANRTWQQADIEFAPITVGERTVAVPADEDGMWIAFVNQLSSGAGITAGFVHDLPSNEGGWGGGHNAIIAAQTAVAPLPGFYGSILAHEIGHVLLGDTHHGSPSNLMTDRRHPRVVSADLLEPGQISRARTRAQSLSA